MNMEFYRKLPIPKEIKEEFPLSKEGERALCERKNEINKIFSSQSDKFALIIGPCSADREDAVLDYLLRLRSIQERVADKIIIIPRVFTNKPRTTGEGYKGMLHQPDPNGKPDLLAGILAIRHMHIKAIEESGFGCADEMLYPENHRYLSDLLAYVTVGARSVENQQHRLVASGLDIPTGMKNPTSGNLSVMMNAIKTAQGSHMFLYRGWEVESHGNPMAHAVLRGFVDGEGASHPNYRPDTLHRINEEYKKIGLNNPGVIVDASHSNSGKDYLRQADIAKEVIECRKDPCLKNLVKGLMIESYIEDGAQKICDHTIYGKSVTDPCLGWEKTERLIYEIAEVL